MTLPNRIGANILDTAQLKEGADRAMDLIRRLDMAQITVVHGSHPKEAIEFIQRVKRERGDRTDIFFRDISKLQDERFPASMTPQEWVNLMYPRWRDYGVIPVTWNEAGNVDMTAIVNWTLECVELAAKVGMSLCTMKTADGTPVGYKDEEPDNYSIANPLWERAIELNKSRMDKGEKPLVYIAPHMGFDMTGGGGGHVDRPLEIIDRIKRLGLDPRYLGGISFGEITSIGGGWRKLKLDPAAYANAFDIAFRDWFDQYGGTSMFYCIGDSVGGRWHDEDLSGDDAKPFWDRLEFLAKDGRYRVKPFAAIPAPEPPVVIPTPTQPNYAPDTVLFGAQYRIKTGGTFRWLRKTPALTADKVGTVGDAQIVTVLERRTVGTDYWYDIRFQRGLDNLSGWVSQDGGIVRFLGVTSEFPTVPPLPPEEPAPTLPPPYIELSREFMLEMQAYHIYLARANLEAAVANEAIAALWGRLLAPAELPKAA